MRASVIAPVLALGLAAPALAEAPLSAIDWLSDSIAQPPMEGAQTGSDVTTNAAVGQIEVQPLGKPVGDAVGLLPPSATGLPRDLWGRSTTEDIVARLDAVPLDPLPSLRRLLTA
ncbi:MAG: hypothetical protein AAFR34_09320, partial [Pseudomonadota bacterium]